MSTRHIGVLLVQLGTPEAPTAEALRPYLRQFLSDRRVVDLSRLIWLPLLHGIILRTRPKRSAALYAKIWGADGRSPLLAATADLAANVAKQLPDAVTVRYAMRYGSPAVDAVIEQMLDAGVTHLLTIPLFPQYASATTASVIDAVYAAVAPRRGVPSLRFAEPYYAHPDYVRVLAASIAPHLQAEAGRTPPHLLFSFHGEPQRYVDEGDPYETQCRHSAQVTADALGLSAEQWSVAFQSQFGKEPWIGPATDARLAALPGEGIKRVVTVCPGFAADCLETLEEIAMEGRETFLQAGGEAFDYIPCLNAGDEWAAALAAIIRQELGGWLES
ncbi:ferrochelatase [Magnetofaba australis]|uniref:Ferrochelatase n=1 Tax=Magnetofaba australis IT-1 TaxID=1434232 RepID=A0A1Y2K052_9PROT|nr:ferrochelatase [Magnetofaba australis]OSM00174.1 putative ferrochelatase [Magnetofaba australis IT-1]